MKQARDEFEAGLMAEALRRRMTEPWNMLNLEKRGITCSFDVFDGTHLRVVWTRSGGVAFRDLLDAPSVQVYAYFDDDGRAWWYSDQTGEVDTATGLPRRVVEWIAESSDNAK